MPPADGSTQTPSQRWLDATLWTSAPNTAHLRKFRPRTRAAVPAALLDGFEAVDTIRLSGLPAGAEVIGGDADGTGGWLLSSDAAKDFAVIPAPGNDAADAQITVEITGRENGGEDGVTLLGGLAVKLPATQIGPLFRDLPDIQKARARKDAAEKAAREGAAKEAEKPKAPPPARAQKAEPKPVATLAPTRPAQPAPKPPAKLAFAKPTAAKPAVTAAPKPQPKPEPKPAPKSAPKPVQNPAPPKPTVAPRPAKPAAKPAVVRRPAKAPAPAPAPSGPILIELGGAPEVGDPHFRVFIDDEQVLDGNIDWGLGLPAAGEDADGICWQSREVPWDFTAGPPGEIVLRYDGGGPGESGAGTLMARAIDLGGVRIEADGPHAHRPDSDHAWAGRGNGRSWVGPLVFDVAVALGRA
jgi:hypothetical protein